MKFNLKIIRGYFSKNLIWVRFGVNSAGFKLSRTRLLFSERNGYKKYIKLPFGWRVSFLNRPSSNWIVGKNEYIRQ
jgi:hypothetical protein